ncbi:MAG: helix-turn-helix domain-containing protein [Solirubrobacteraceae bacterium]|nr:helix-turn-helix domain-containing protein [Solirubrobacteraceae bacterium]
MTSLRADVVQEIAREARAQGAVLAATAVERVTGELGLDFATRRNLEVGTRTAVDRFVGVLEDPEAELDTALYEAHGRAQCAAGRSLRELLAIYRATGLVLWEAVAAMPATDRLTGSQAMELGARWLQLMDGLSVAAVDGYLEEGAEQRRRDRARRDRLHGLLLSEPPEDPAAIVAAAARAGWSLPERVRVAVGAVPAESDAADAERSPAKVLAGSVGHDRLAFIVGDGPEAEVLLRRAADAHDVDGPITIGPAVAPAKSATSVQRASALLDQIEAGSVGAAPVVRCDDHEVPLLLGAAPDLIDGLVERRLAPLLALPEGRRAQVAETLGAWLAEPHRPQAIADRLGVHVGTIRYRLARLRELFGDDLDNPDVRLELQLALKALGARHGDGAVA